MKRLFFIMLSAVLLVSCGGSDSYKIKGTIMGLEDGTVVTLSSLFNNDLLPLDSATVKNGKFTMKGKTDTCEVAVITFDFEEQLSGFQFFLESGDILIDFDVANGTQSITGTKNNDAFQNFYDMTEVLNDQVMELDDKIRITTAAQGDVTDLYNQMEDIRSNYKSLVAESITKDPSLLFAYEQLVENYSLFEPQEVLSFQMLLAPYFQEDPAFQQIFSMMQAMLMTSVGSKYIDFSAEKLSKEYRLSGKVTFSDIIKDKKVVLLDFWASWCAPCLGEIPYMKEAYKKFKSKGFEIISVSVDESVVDWTDAIKENGMNWTHLWNGLDDMENSAAVKYVVSAIPCTFLIDSEGTIIARDLRGDDLAKALEDYFKK